MSEVRRVIPVPVSPRPKTAIRIDSMQDAAALVRASSGFLSLRELSTGQRQWAPDADYAVYCEASQEYRWGTGRFGDWVIHNGNDSWSIVRGEFFERGYQTWGA